MDVSELARILADDVKREADVGSMLRAVRQFIMDADRTADPSEMIFQKPPSTGDRRWDALVAGVVEDIAFRHGASTPAWTRSPDLYLDEWWFVTRSVGLHRVALAETPAAVANHGVFIRRDSLVNV